jgi:uncharacterized membrane protein required for colicin V production
LTELQLSSFSWVDGALTVLVLLLAVLGWHRGFVGQLAAVVAILTGIWIGVVVKQWVGAHWAGAHPTVVFWALSWLVAVLSAFAALTLINVIGDTLGRAAQAGPVAWIDRTLGIAAGAVMGLVLASLLVLAAARLPMGSFVERSLARAHTSRSLLAGGAEACRLGGRFPGARGLRQEFVFAHQRLERESPSI